MGCPFSGYDNTPHPHDRKGGTMSVIHLRDPRISRVPIHFDSRIEHLRLTDNPELVTCKRCLAMMKRAKRGEEGK